MITKCQKNIYTWYYQSRLFKNLSPTTGLNLLSSSATVNRNPTTSLISSRSFFKTSAFDCYLFWSLPHAEKQRLTYVLYTGVGTLEVNICHHHRTHWLVNFIMGYVKLCYTINFFGWRWWWWYLIGWCFGHLVLR